MAFMGCVGTQRGAWDETELVLPISRHLDPVANPVGAGCTAGGAHQTNRPALIGTRGPGPVLTMAHFRRAGQKASFNNTSLRENSAFSTQLCGQNHKFLYERSVCPTLSLFKCRCECEGVMEHAELTSV